MITDSVEVLVISVSHQCSSLQLVAVSLLLVPCESTCWSCFGSLCCLCLCNGRCAGSLRSQLSEGATHRIALCCLVLTLFRQGCAQKKKAVAVVERTKDCISCLRMRGELSPLPSAALLCCSTCLQSCRSPSVILLIRFVAWFPPPFTTAD